MCDSKDITFGQVALKGGAAYVRLSWKLPRENYKVTGCRLENTPRQ